MMLRAAVIGVGRMGQHHARVYAEMEDVRLVAVADVDEKRAREISRKHGGKPYAYAEALCQEAKPDVVSIATPTAYHGVVKTVLEHGAHALIEKPIAATLGDATDYVVLARERQAVLAVGHIERYNPAVIAAKKVLDRRELGDVYHMGFRRLGPAPKRIRDVGVTLDLATHDLDLAHYLADSKPSRVCGVQQFIRHKNLDDSIGGWVMFQSGVMALVMADWLTAAKIRRATITCEKGVLLLDLIAQAATVYRNTDHDAYTVPIAKKEPLRTELEEFCKAVRGEETNIATGEDGLIALQMALGLCASAKETMILHL